MIELPKHGNYVLAIVAMLCIAGLLSSVAIGGVYTSAGVTDRQGVAVINRFTGSVHHCDFDDRKIPSVKPTGPIFEKSFIESTIERGYTPKQSQKMLERYRNSDLVQFSDDGRDAICYDPDYYFWEYWVE